MINSDNHEVRRLEIQDRLMVLDALTGDGFTDELQKENEGLLTELKTLGVRKRTSLKVEGAAAEAAKAASESSEGREYRELRSKVGLNRYIEAATEKRAVSGAEAEFNQMFGVGLHRFPLEILAPHEERAKTGVDTAVGVNRWLDRLFSVSAAARVGVTFESVPAGTKSYPVVTAGATGKQRGRTEDAAIATWTVGVSELKPTRNSVHAVFSREDDLRNPGLQAALTRDLRMAVSDAVDLAVFEGDTGANEDTADITGLDTAADVEEETLTQLLKLKGTNVLSAFAAMIDGKHATSGSDLRVVLSVGAKRLWMSTLANSGGSVDTTIEEFLKRAGIETSSRGGIDTATTAGKFGAFVGRSRGIEGAGIAAYWSDGMLVVDPYSSARSSEIRLSLHTFWAFGLPRPSNFARLKFVA